MAIQEYTVIKLVGAAASDAADRFDRWWKARVSDDDDPWGFRWDEWSPAVRREASAYLASLVEHRWGMPVAYFSRHIDLWTGGGVSIVGRFPDEPEPLVMHDAGQLWCHRLPDGGKLIERNRPDPERPPVHDGAWLPRRLIEAANAYDTVWPEAVVLLNRQAIGPSSSDDELKRAAAELPTWLGRSTAG